MAPAEDMIDEILAAVKTGDVTHVPQDVKFRRSGKDARMLIGSVDKDLVNGGVPDKYLIASGSDQAQVWVYRYGKWQEDRVRYIAYGNGKDGRIVERQLSNTTVAKMEPIDERLSYFSIFNSAAGKKLYPKEQDRKRAHEKWMVFVLGTKAPVVSEVDSDEAPPKTSQTKKTSKKRSRNTAAPGAKTASSKKKASKPKDPPLPLASSSDSEAGALKMSDSDEDATAEPAKKKPKVLDSASTPPKTPKKSTAPVTSGRKAAPTTAQDASRALWDQFNRGIAELDLDSSETMRLLLLGAQRLGLPYGEATEDLLRRAHEEVVLGRKTLGTLRIVDTDAWRMAITESTREQSPAKLNLSNQQQSGSAFTPVKPGKAPAATPFTPANQNTEMEVQTPKTLDEARAFKKTHKKGTNDSPSVKVAHRAAEKLITESLKINI